MTKIRLTYVNGLVSDLTFKDEDKAMLTRDYLTESLANEHSFFVVPLTCDSSAGMVINIKHLVTVYLIGGTYD